MYNLLQEGRVLSFGSPKDGKLGRRNVAAGSDGQMPQPMPIDACKIKAEGATEFEFVDNGFVDVQVAGIAAGWWHNIFSQAVVFSSWARTTANCLSSLLGLRCDGPAAWQLLRALWCVQYVSQVHLPSGLQGLGQAVVCDV